MPIQIRQARLADAKPISLLLNAYAAKGLMLSRDTESVIVSIRNFIVAEKDGELAGCCAMAFFSEEMAEIRSLVVHEEFQRQGIGRKLVEACEKILRDEGIKTVFALTLQGVFFEKLDYQQVEKTRFPQKIWRDCLNCPKLMACDEIAVQKELVQPLSW